MERTGSEVQTDILIGGAGFAGLALAAALAKAGLSVVVADPALARPEHPDPRALTLVAGVRRMLEALGAWPAISDEAEAVRAMEITDSRLADLVRPALLSFAEEAAPGEPFAHVAPNDMIRPALLDAAKAAGVTLIPAPILSCEVGAWRAFGAGRRSIGTRYRPRLVVAADGARSRLRQHGPDPHPWLALRSRRDRHDAHPRTSPRGRRGAAFRRARHARAAAASRPARLGGLGRAPAGGRAAERAARFRIS